MIDSPLALSEHILWLELIIQSLKLNCFRQEASDREEGDGEEDDEEVEEEEMDAEESSDESDSELDEKGTDVYCKTMYCKTFFYKSLNKALNLHKKILGHKFSIKEDFRMQILLVKKKKMCK